MEIPMKTIFWVTCMAALQQAPVGTTVTYSTDQGSEKKELRATYAAPKADSWFRMGYEGLPSQIRNLPLWLPPDSRTTGTVVYDDGEGFKHDKGRMAYALRSTGTWKKFDTLIVSYAYQGMQRFDNWSLEAHYDRESGFLLWAAVSTRMVDSKPHVTFELTLSSSTDPALKNKLG
jgi:hypothetical protein